MNISLISDDVNRSGLTVFDLKNQKYLKNGILGTYTLESGQLLFGPFRILSSGTFELIAKSENFNSSIIQSFNISNLEITNNISDVNLKVSNEVISIYQKIEFTVSIFGEDKNSYKFETLVEISDSNGLNKLNCTGVNGQCSGELNASECGNFSFTAESQNIISLPQTVLVEKWILVPETLIIVFFM